MPPTGHKPVPNPADLELGAASPGPPAHRFPWENSWNEMAPAVAAAPRAQYPPFLVRKSQLLSPALTGPPRSGRAAGTHVKAKKRVVAPTRKMAAAETGTYLLGLNLFPEADGMLELWWGVRPAA